MADICEGLDEQQRVAVRHGDTPLLIWAGPGSGKTRTLTYRVAHLVLDRGVDPSNILVTTFTKRAANEMKVRLTTLIGGGVYGLAIGTTHSLCNRIIRRCGPELVGLRPRFSIYDQGDQKGVTKKVVVDLLGQRPGAKKLVKGWTKQVVRAISFAKDCDIGPSYWPAADAVQPDCGSLPGELDWEGEPAPDLPWRELYTEYDRRLRAANAADFGDLQTLAVHLLEDNPAILAEMRATYQYVLVDEFQDINPVQATLFNMISQEHRRLTAVGDGNQSIFSFRASTPKFALDFAQRWPDGTTVKLERNYRSTSAIVSASNAVIQNNENRYALTCYTSNPPGDPVRVTALETPQQEATEAAATLERYHRAGVPWQEMAILCRIRRSLRSYESALIDRSVPHHMHGTLGFFERAEVKDVLCWLRLCVNPSDVVSFERACGSVPQRMGATTVARIVEFAAAQSLPILEAAQQVRSILTLRKPAVQATALFLARIAKLQEHLAEPTLIETVLEETGYQDELAKRVEQQDEDDDDDDDEVTFGERLAHLRELAALYARHHESVAEGESAADSFLSNVVLGDNPDSDADEVWVGTIHAAKGTEFDVVLVVDCEDGIYPHRMSLTGSRAPAGLPEPDDEPLEEERRIWYVAITRARKHLHLLWSRSRRMFVQSEWGGSRMADCDTRPSPFIEETCGRGAAGSRPAFTPPDFRFRPNLV